MLLQAPAQYRHQAVAFACRFTKEGTLFRQGPSPYSPDRHLNFMVWPVEAPLWEKSARRQLLSSLYVSRANEEAVSVLRGLGRYDTVKIVGVVEDVYANLPWITVEKIVPIPGERLDDAMLQQVAQGRDYLKSGNREKAELCFEMALGNGAPAFVRQYIQNLNADYAPQRTIEEKPVENFMPLVEAAREAARNKDMGEAEKLYRSAQDKCADNAWLYKEVGLFYEYGYSLRHDRAMLEQALKAYRKAEMLNGGPDADIHFLQARVAFERDRDSHDYAAAEALVNECLRLNHGHAMARRLAAAITAEKLASAKEPETETATLAVEPMPAIARRPEPVTAPATAPRPAVARATSALVPAPRATAVTARPLPTASRQAPGKKTAANGKPELPPEQHFQIASTLVRNNNFASAVKHLEAAAASDSPCAGEARMLLVSSLFALRRDDEARRILAKEVGARQAQAAPRPAAAPASIAVAPKPAPVAEPATIASAADVPALSAADLGMDELAAEMDKLTFEVAGSRGAAAEKPQVAQAPVSPAVPAPASPASAPVAAPARPAVPAPAAPSARPAPQAPAAPLVTPKNVSADEIPDWAL